MENKKTLFSIDQARLQRLLTFFVIILGASIAMKLSSIKDAFYEPMRTAFDMSHAEFGATRSIYGIVQMIGYVPAMFIADRFSKKTMIPFSLLALAAIGMYFATIPGYAGLLLVFALLAIFGEMTYWPIMLKSVRLLGDKDEQGRLFGFLEGGRGVVDIFASFSALALFAWIGEGLLGLKAAIYFYSALLVVAAILSYKLLDHDIIDNSDEGIIKGSKRVLAGIKEELHKKELWLLAFTVFFIWVTYAGLTSFIPFLKDIYGLPLLYVGVYGVINQYALKLVGGPAAGILADKYFKSPLKTMRVAFVGGVIGLIILRFYPHGNNITMGMVLTLGMASFVFMLRALAFSPMAELKIPKERVGSALALVCLVGYSANIFAYTMYGALLDSNPGIAGYNYVFLVMIGTLTMAFILSTLAFNIVHKKQNETVQEDK